MTKRGSSALLDLPRELRDEIYIHVLHQQKEPPQSIDEVLSTRPERQIGEDERATLQYEDKPVAISSSGLLRTNRQIASEVRKLFASHAFPSVLDVHTTSYANWHYAYSTWLALPTPPQFIQDVKVVFHMDYRTSKRLSGVWHGNGGIGAITLAFLELLARFLAHGPLLEARGGDDQRWKPLHLRTITIEYVPDPEEGPACIWWVPDDTEDLAKVQSVIPQEAHVAALAGYLDMIARSGLLYGKVRKLDLKYIGRHWRPTEPRGWKPKFEDRSWGSLATWIPESQPAEEVEATARLYGPYGWFSKRDSYFVRKFT